MAARVVLVTGGAFTPSASDYLASVGNLQIEKPFDQATLRKTVNALVEARRSRA